MAYDEKQYLQHLGIANGNPTFVVDAGNSLVKVFAEHPIVPGRNSTDFASYPHALIEVSAADYEEQTYRYADSAAPHLIRWRDRFFVVGEEAYSMKPSLEPRQGRVKYSRDYIGILVVSALLRLCGSAVPERINLMIGYPPGDRRHIDQLLASVSGGWAIESAGVKHKFRVDYVVPFDEIVGGILNYTLGVDGKPVTGIPLLEGGVTLGFDLGGGTLDLSRINRDGTVDYDKQMLSVRTGGNQAITNFKRLFDQRHADLLREAEDGVPRQVVMEVFLDPRHELHTMGQTIDCRAIYQQSIAPVIRDARDAVIRYTGGFIGYDKVLLTGGIAGLMLPDIREHIFSEFDRHGAMHTSGRPSDMYRSNPSGARKTIPNLLSEGERRGNTYLKANGVRGKR